MLAPLFFRSVMIFPKCKYDQVVFCIKNISDFLGYHDEIILLSKSNDKFLEFSLSLLTSFPLSSLGSQKLLASQ